MKNELRCDECGHVHGNGTYCNEVAGETEDEVIIYCDCKFPQATSEPVFRTDVDTRTTRQCNKRPEGLHPIAFRCAYLQLQPDHCWVHHGGVFDESEPATKTPVGEGDWTCRRCGEQVPSHLATFYHEAHCAAKESDTPAGGEAKLAAFSILFASHGFDPRIGGRYEQLIRDCAAICTESKQPTVDRCPPFHSCHICEGRDGES